MTTYLYETIPSQDGDAVAQIEIQQGMNDEPLTHHPETGQPIRRVILGGWGLKKRAVTLGAADGECGCGPGGCC